MQTIGSLSPVLVTGASGFIGGHMLRHLRSNTRHDAIPATRDGSIGSRRLDLRDVSTLRSALTGIKSVVHCAVGNRAVTVDGTRALLAACREAGVRRFVHMSSVAVYGTASGAVVEETPMLPAGGKGYAAWKAAAEQACLQQQGLEVVRLRPAIVYGPGSKLWIADLASRIRSGQWGTFGEAGEGTCNLVHVSDVVTAAEQALERPDVAGAVFNLSGTEPMTWNGWFNCMAEALAAPRLRPISSTELRLRVLASLPLKAARRLRPKFSAGLATSWLQGAPAASELELFALKATYPIDAARAALHWQPQIRIGDGLAGCMRWLEQT